MKILALLEDRKIGNAFLGYLSPFKTSSSWVEDARGSSVCEATNAKTAEVICTLLNEKYPVRQAK